MPIYTYESKDGTRIEALRPMRDRNNCISRKGKVYWRVMEQPQVIARHFTPADDTGKRILQGWKDIEAKEGSAFSLPFSHDAVKQACGV